MSHWKDTIMNDPTLDEDGLNPTAEVLTEVGTILDRYVAFPSPEARDAVTLWVAHAHVFRHFDSTPRLAILSTEPGSGKSRLLEIIEHLVPNPVQALNAHPAILWRSIEQVSSATLLLDEVDTIFGRQGSGSSHMALRSLLNAGHKAGAVIPRLMAHEVRNYSVFAPVAMAGLGQLPDTLMTRSVIIRMKRRKGDQEIMPFRLRFAHTEMDCSKFALEEWAEEMTSTHAFELALPEMPVTDRAADVWEPLVSIADLAGPDWHERAVAAVTELTRDERTSPVDLAGELIKDTHAVFNGAAQMSTVDLLNALYEKTGKVQWTPENLSPRLLARILGEFGVKPTTLREGDEVFKGYKAQEFAPHWARVVEHQEEGVTV